MTLKSDFLLDPRIIFLNHGSFGATPRPVFELYQQWQLELERQPVEFLGRRANQLLASAREDLADYLHTAAGNLVFVSNATTGLNVIARSLHLGIGDEVLASDHEYGALDRTWRFLSKKTGFKYINQPVPVPVTDTQQFVDQFWQAVTPRTRVIFISHITSPTAIIFPVKQICEKARQSGIWSVVDGAHAPGQIPLALDELGADFYSGNLHKWLCAPKGSAFLFARPDVQHLIEPLVISWGWEPEIPGDSSFIDHLQWTGTRDLSAFLSVPRAISYQAQHDWNKIREDCHNLLAHTLPKIVELTGLPLFYPPAPGWFAQMASAPLPTTLDLDRLKARLYDDYQIEVPLVGWNGHKLIRVSVQAYNSAADLDALVDALEKCIINMPIAR